VRIVITECDHDSFAPERDITDPAGAELVLTRSHTAAELIAGAEGADAILVQYAQITTEVMDALPQLRAVGRYGVGVDSVDVNAATARVYTSPNLTRAIELIASGALGLDRFPTKDFSLTDVSTAFDAATSGQDCLKVLVTALNGKADA
jgi:D-3-phosphoglycerate dehydrogenase